MITWSRAPVVVAAAGMVLVACGGGGSDAEEAVDVGGVEAPDRAAGDEPAGTDPEAVRPYIEELLAQYDQVVNEIVIDPSVARNPEDPLMERYLNLYEPDSEFAGQLVQGWLERADEGLSTRPLDAEHPTSESAVDGDIPAGTADEISFPYCVERHYVVHDDAGRQVQRVPEREQPGTGTAVRVEGQWRLRELTVRSDAAACRSTS